MDIELGPVDRITADAVGPAGQRTFFIQGRKDDRIVTVLLEKQQVQLLAASVVEILAQIGKPTGEGPPEEAMGLEEPVEARWRAGRLSIGYDETRDLFLLEIEEFQPDLEEDDPARLLLEEPEELRLWATREQMLALSRHATEVAERGRPTCQYCGNPIDPRGHACPAMNGHHKEA